jgi:hypothetical protein
VAYVIGAVFAALWLQQGTALGYSPTGAVTWAESHANPGTENCQLSVCLTNDCTAFVSQVLWWGGGYTQTTPKTTDIHNANYWWERSVTGGGFAFTDSWGGADMNYKFQIAHNPGGTLVRTWPGTATSSASGISAGSLFFYNWDSTGKIDHVSIHVGSGLDPASGWVGDYVDQHSTGLNPAHFKHGFWSSQPYNPNPTATTIYAVRISSSN